VVWEHESEDESKDMLTVCCVLVDVMILVLFGWSTINCFVGKLVVGGGEKNYFWQMGAKSVVDLLNNIKEKMLFFRRLKR